MAAGDASAIATAINTAISNNATDGDGRANMAGIATATASGNVVTLTVNDGKKVEILRDGDTLSTGAGTVTINPVTMGGPSKTLDDAYVSQGYDLIRDGRNVSAIVRGQEPSG